MMVGLPKDYYNAIELFNDWTVKKLEAHLDKAVKWDIGKKRIREIRKQLEETRKLISIFFKKEPQKMDWWIQSPNPLLGGISPLAMLVMGRFERLKQFIVVSLWENSPPGTKIPKKYKKYFPKEFRG